MSEEEKLKIEQECLLKYSKAKMIEKYINTLEENQQLKEVIEEVKRVLRCNNIEVLKYYDEPSETGSYEIVTVDLLQILDKVKGNRLCQDFM